jgi:hypothetical protein
MPASASPGVQPGDGARPAQDTAPESSMGGAPNTERVDESNGSTALEGSKAQYQPLKVLERV